MDFRLALSSRRAYIMHYKHVAPRPRVLGTQTARIKKGFRAVIEWN